jgi:hypothetical protein
VTIPTVFLSLSLLLFIPDELKDIRFVLKHVETHNQPDAIGDNGKAYGVLQIHKIAVDDVNRLYGTDYTHQDAFNVVCSEEIFNLAIKAGIKRYKRIYCRSPTEGELVRMWNGGIYRGYKIDATLKYYKRYKKFKKLLCE